MKHSMRPYILLSTNQQGNLSNEDTLWPSGVYNNSISDWNVLCGKFAISSVI